jgi:hypothetical protein
VGDVLVQLWIGIKNAYWYATRDPSNYRVTNLHTPRTSDNEQGCGCGTLERDADARQRNHVELHNGGLQGEERVSSIVPRLSSMSMIHRQT